MSGSQGVPRTRLSVEISGVSCAYALLWVGALGCAAALRDPPPLERIAPAAGPGPGADALLAEADAAWALRADPAQVQRAERLYLAAAAADDRRVDGLLGAMRAMAARLEREPGAAARTELATSQVQAGQWCLRRAPGSAACEYRLAIALGQQARERPSTAADGLSRMVELLRSAARVEPGLDGGGPHRVLALLLLRAPGWPAGPGDPEEALAEAERARVIAPDHPHNQLALAEALARGGRREEARRAYERALALAESAARQGLPEAEAYAAEARRGLR